MELFSRPSLLARLSARYNISHGRLLLVQLGVLLLIAGSLFDMVTGGEHWPFSAYPMYSRVELERSTTKLHLFGVPIGQADNEIPLRAVSYIVPFDKTRLNSALRKLQRQSPEDHLLRVAVSDMLERYEVLRESGRHDGPPLQAIRLYELHWSLDPWARNVNQPDDRKLLLEVKREP